MIPRLFNNLGVCSLSIAFTAQHYSRALPIPKALLVFPLVTHRSLLNHLSRKNASIGSLEGLLISKLMSFSNFNARFYDGLCESVNAIQMLVDFEIAAFTANGLEITTPLQYQPMMGKRVEKVWKAAPRIAQILSNSQGQLYSSLRVQL